MSYCDLCGSGTHDELDHKISTHSECLSKKQVMEAIEKHSRVGASFIDGKDLLKDLGLEK